MINFLKAILSRQDYYKFPIKGYNFFESIRLYRRFWKDFKEFNKTAAARQLNSAQLNYIYPILNENTKTQSSKPGHYFYQPLWLMKRIKTSEHSTHIDIGSQINMLGFLSLEKTIEYIDIRDPQIKILNFKYIKASITNLPYKDNSVDSLSSLHVIEHIGLGRYGDDIDPLGHVKAFAEIRRVLKSGGDFYLSLPCGKERINFNAHRVFHPKTIIDLLYDFDLISLSAVNDNSEFIENASIEELAQCNFGCGMFHFNKK